MKVCQYLRMSTEQQRYSIENQKAALAEYAAHHRMEIVESYIDSGRSGLTLLHRPSLKLMITHITDGTPPFEAVLIYDVSRWGRFQDPDESAFYEHLIRRCGVRIVYCNEPFENDGSPASTIFKSVKRAMAAEYSRELSNKVSAGQRRLAARGYRQGSSAGFGLCRVAVSESGERLTALRPGEHKGTHTDRVVLRPGPPEEVSIVRRIFSLYVHGRVGPQRIAAILVGEDAPTGELARWHKSAVAKILKNEKYIGINVYGKQRCRLRGQRANVPFEQWIRVEGAFPAIVERRIFEAAQELRKSREMPSDKEILLRLKRLHKRHGRIVTRLVQGDPELPSISYIRQRFGTFSQACERALGRAETSAPPPTERSTTAEI